MLDEQQLQTRVERPLMAVTTTDVWWRKELSRTLTEKTEQVAEKLVVFVPEIRTKFYMEVPCACPLC